MSWDEDLQEAKLDGIAFPIGARRVGYSRDGARIRLPYVDGQDVEDTGRNPRTYSIDLPLFPDIEGYEDLYPGVYEQLLELAESDRSLTQVVYTDPVHGDVDVRIWSVEETTSPDERDGARLRIEMEELTFDSTGTAVTPRRSATRDGDEASREADDAIADPELEVDEEQVQKAMDSSGYPQTPAQRRGRITGAPIETMWRDFTTSITSAARSVDEATAAVDSVRSRVNAVLALPVMNSTSAWQFRSAMLRIVDAARRVAEQAVASAVPTLDVTVVGEVSVVDLAVSLYRDASRVDEVLRRNSLRTPHAVRAGTRLRLAQR